MGLTAYVAFLRGINIGATRRVPMAGLRSALEAQGFTGVETYGQSGNVRLASPLTRPEVAEAVEDLVWEQFEVDVPCMAFTTAELAQVYDDALRCESTYLFLFRERPGEHDGLTVIGRVAHLPLQGNLMYADLGAATSNFLEPSTSRTLNVVRTCVERWC